MDASLENLERNVRSAREPRAELTEGDLTMGRKQLEAAIAIWSDCIQADRWPAYPSEIQHPQYPAYAEAQWIAREIEEEQRA